MTQVTLTFRVHNPRSASLPLVLNLCRPALESDTAGEIEQAMGLPGYSFAYSTDGGGAHDKHCDVLWTLTGSNGSRLKLLAEKFAALLRDSTRRTVEVSISNDANFNPVYRYTCN